MTRYKYILAALMLACLAPATVRAGRVVVKGSTTVYPIVQKAAEAFMSEHSGVRISISGGGSGNGIKALIDGNTDIALSSRFIKEREVARAVERGAYPVPFLVAYDCIVPVVHPSNPLENLTLEQLKAIYQGQIRNWKELGGPDKRIVAVSRDGSSGTYEVWEQKVMRNQRVYPGALLQASNGAMVQAVSKNPHAIGYIGLGYLSETVKALTVNGIRGSVETTLDGSYPLNRPLFMFTRGWPSGDVFAFIRYLLDPAKGQRYVRQIGFVPLYRDR